MNSAMTRLPSFSFQKNFKNENIKNLGEFCQPVLSDFQTKKRTKTNFLSQVPNTQHTFSFFFNEKIVIS